MKKLYKLTIATLIITCCSYISTAQSWEMRANAPLGRHHPISFSVDGKGYAITGTRFDGTPTTNAYEYDPVKDTWTTLPNFPGNARSFGIGTVVDGIAYMGFGASTTQYLNDLWSFDPKTNTWNRLADCGCEGRRHPAMIAIGTRIYVGLGDNFRGDRNDWWMYEITTNTWSQISNFAGPPRHHPFMFNAGGDVFAGLGHSGQVIYKDWYKLDTATNTWSAMKDFPGEARVAGTQFSYGGFGFVLSGDGDNHSFMATGEMWRYDPRDDSWLQLTPHPGQSRWAPGSFVIGDHIYFYGGLNRATRVYPTDLMRFNLVGNNVGVNTAVNNANIQVYPNPVSDILRWQSTVSISNVKVFNLQSQLVMEAKEVNQINLNTLQNGLYMVQLYSGNQLVKKEKVFVQK